MSSYLKLDSTLNTSMYLSNAAASEVGDVDNATFIMWCRLSSRTPTKTLFQKYDGSTGYEAKLNEEINGDISLEFTVDGTTTVVSRIESIPVKLNEWQMFAFVLDRSGNQSIYIDAVEHPDTLNAVSSPAGAVEPATDFYIGKDDLNPSGEELGSINVDSFAHFLGALTTSEIRGLYNKGRGIKYDDTTVNIVRGYNFDDGTGNKASEKTGILTWALTIVSDADPFDNVWGETGGVAVMLPSDIKMYLTSLEPYMAQTNYTQSIGGHISTSLLYPETTLDASLGLYEKSLTLNNATDLLGYNYLSILNEIMKVESVTSTNVTITERGVNDIIGYYPSGKVVQGIISPFSDSFNEDRKQYRCYAIKNTSENESAYNVSCFFGQVSSNKSTIMRLALEAPRSQGVSGVSSSWTSSILVDISIAGTYEDNLFSDSYMTIVDGPNATYKTRISSYDGTTGTFVLADSLPVDFNEEIHSSLVSYTVDVSPAQRVKTGTEAPENTDYITDFSEAADRGGSVELSSIGGFATGGNIAPDEIFYVWVERAIGKSNDSYDENSFVLNVEFEKELEGN